MTPSDMTGLFAFVMIMSIALGLALLIGIRHGVWMGAATFLLGWPVVLVIVANLFNWKDM